MNNGSRKYLQKEKMLLNASVGYHSLFLATQCRGSPRFMMLLNINMRTEQNKSHYFPLTPRFAKQPSWKHNSPKFCKFTSRNWRHEHVTLRLFAHPWVCRSELKRGYKKARLLLPCNSSLIIAEFSTELCDTIDLLLCSPEGALPLLTTWRIYLRNF